jgi:hypothetical protein
MRGAIELKSAAARNLCSEGRLLISERVERERERERESFDAFS